MSTTQRMARVMCAVALAVSSATIGAQTTNQTGSRTEGIKVHGQWTIDIKNPDGTLVRRHEFENALQPPGALNLARFLARQNAPGRWVVLLDSPVGTPPCSPSGVPCVVSENRWFSAVGGDLSIDVPTSGPNQGQLVLTGSFTSPDARSFVQAVSGFDLCPPGAPACQQSTTGGNFTLKDFAPISVRAGQIVQVTVVISFS